MNNPIRWTLRLMAVVVLGLLASCIDSREELWIEADGSGRANFRFSLPASAVQMQGGEGQIREMIGNFLKKTPKIKQSSQQVSTHNGRTQVDVSIRFDSALDLMNATSGAALQSLPSAASHLAGKLEAHFNEGGIALTRTIYPAKALPGVAFYPKSQLAGYQFTTILHLPVAATKSNATRTENDGRTLIWETPLSAAVLAPVVTYFQLGIPSSWRAAAIASLCFFVICGLVWLIIKLQKRRKNCTL